MHEAPIKRSLYRPALWAGVERIPGIFLVLASIALATTAIMKGPVWLLAVAAVIGGGGWSLLRHLAEFDPHFFRVVPVWAFKRTDHYRAVQNLGQK
jgi:type IV secretory pathway TrbD component